MRLIFAGAPDVGATTQAVPQDSAGGALMQMLIMLLIFFAMMYFLVIMPQRRREKEFKQMVENLKRGDTIITTGGIVGKIVDIKKDTVKIKSSNTTELEVHKAYIAKVVKEKEEAQEDNAKEDSKD